MQDILNTLDGGDTKGMNIITLFTTNHIELIEPTFLRGKRIGSVISLGPLDAETAMVFLKEAFGNGYVLNGDFTEVCKLIEQNHIAPAFMAEIVESVKSHMVFMEDSTKVEPSYIEASVKSYVRQVNLAQKKDMSMTPEMELAEALRNVTGVKELAKNIDYIVKIAKENWDE